MFSFAIVSLERYRLIQRPPLLRQCTHEHRAQTLSTVLLQYFTKMASARFDRPLPVWTAEQMRSWIEADWPGNVRELRNFADRLVLGIGEDTVNEAAPIGEIVASADAASLSARVNAFERQIIEDALKHNQGIVARTAEALHLPKKTLYDKLRKHRIELGRE